MEIDEAVIKIIPADIARKYTIFPVAKAGATVTVAMIDPTNVFAMDDVKFMTGYRVEPVVASETAIRGAIDRYYGSTHAIELKKVMEDLSEDIGERPGGPRGGGGPRPRDPRRGVRAGAGGQAGQPDPDRCHQARRLGHPHRALREGLPGPLPHRRHPLRDDAPAAQAQGGDHQPLQDHGEARHRREAAAAGRAHQDQDQDLRQDQGPRLPRLRAPHAVRREDRHALARQGQAHARHDEAGLRGGLAAQIRERDPEAVRHGAGHRPHRLGQDQHASTRPCSGSTPRRSTS